MFIKGKYAEKNSLLNTAEKMCAAARTAPKGRGNDYILTAIVTDDEKDKLAEETRKIGEEKQIDFFIRDAQNILNAGAVVLIGSNDVPRTVQNCGYCNFGDCAGMIKNGGHCVFNDIDLGIALGCAASVAGDCHIDNRIMFSVGKAAKQMNLLGEEAKIVFAIALSVSGKNIFFDRTQK